MLVKQLLTNLIKNDFTYSEKIDNTVFVLSNVSKNCKISINKYKGSKSIMKFSIKDTVIQMESSFINFKISLDNFDIFLGLTKAFENDYVVDIILVQKCRFYLDELNQVIKDKFKKKEGRYILFNLYLEEMIGYGIAQNYSFDLKTISEVNINTELNSITKNRSFNINVADKCNSYK